MPRLFAIVFVLLLKTLCALGEIQVNAEWDADTSEQQSAAINERALATQLASSLGTVYEAAGISADVGRSAQVGGALVREDGGSPATTPSPPPGVPSPPPSKPVVVQESSSDNTGLVVAALAIGLVGLVGVAGWYCLRRPSAAKILLPPEIPYKIKPPQPQPQQPVYYSPLPTAPPPPQPSYYAPPPPQQPSYYSPPPPQQPGYYAPPPQPYYAPPQREHTYLVH